MTNPGKPVSDLEYLLEALDETGCYTTICRSIRRAIERRKQDLAQNTHRSEVMNPPASAAMGTEAGNLNMEQRHGAGAVPRGAKARPADAPPPPHPADNTPKGEGLDKNIDAALAAGKGEG